MEQRQMYNKAYVDALRTNESEIQRWSAYRQEHVDLKDNLRMYQRFPSADILIPMGPKALLPGQLYHTSELLVSHGGGYFSECTSEQAQTIAEQRIRQADEMLQKYERERTLYSDKLEFPFINEAFARNEGGREIIEPYDEQVEERWREEHRHRVKESKRKEAAERTIEYQDDKELFEKLEEMELLEELENEMDQLEMPHDDDQLGRLIRGEIRLNSKQRMAHSLQNKTKPVAENVSHLGNDEIGTNKEDMTIPHQIDITAASEDNENGSSEEIVTTDDEKSVDEHDDEDISAEFLQLLNETKNLSKEEKIKILQAKLEDVRKRHRKCTTLDESIDLRELYEELEEALDFLREEKQSKKVSFAEHEDIKLIDGRHGQAVIEKKQFASTEKTLFLPIVHSAERLSNVYRETATKGDIICPADISRTFEQMELTDSPVEIKSILKNNHDVQKKSWNVGEFPSSATDSKCRLKQEEEESLPVDILGDIVEHKIVPDDVKTTVVLPPLQKKKVSKFRQQRQ